MKFSIPSDVLVGQYLQLIALTIAAAIAAVYASGYVVGYTIHRMNARLTDYTHVVYTYITQATRRAGLT